MPEQKIVLKNCGIIDPQNIDTYLAQEGYAALKRAGQLGPGKVIKEIINSGLRGRGGAGFPTGKKWEFCRSSVTQSPNRSIAYIICNADEGEVGAFKDRYILENDPFSVIEGMTLSGYAVGAEKGYIYLRAEYAHLVGLLNNALQQAREKGFLGKINGKDFDLELVSGAGAYICGEETALMESIEGKRGEPRFRPPFPPQQGLWQAPTVIDNVETLANIPRIILNGAEWFSRIGTEKSKGTKVFSVSGDVPRPGVYELTLGSPLRELVENLAGAESIKMVQVGGAAGKLIRQDKLDTPLSFETVLGAGPVIIFNQTRDAVQVAREFMEFFEEESCGKCTPCREGTHQVGLILDKLLEGKGSVQNLVLLEEIGQAMALASLCGLGQTAPGIVFDTLQYFKEDYISKIASSH